MHRYDPGDHVVYRKVKVSAHPTRRAENVQPSPHGEDYTYAVDKYWTVTRYLDPHTIEIKTRTGKLRQLPEDDPNLRKAHLTEEFFKRDRFPSLT